MPLCFVFLCAACNQKGKVTVVAEQISSRERYAVEKLADALIAQGYEVNRSDRPAADNERQIIVGTLKGKLLEEFVKKKQSPGTLAREGFTLQSSGNTIYAAGADNNGALYACMELIDRLRMNGKLPEAIRPDGPT